MNLCQRIRSFAFHFSFYLSLSIAYGHSLAIAWDLLIFRTIFMHIRNAMFNIPPYSYCIDLIFFFNPVKKTIFYSAHTENINRLAMCLCGTFFLHLFAAQLSSKYDNQKTVFVSKRKTDSFWTNDCRNKGGFCETLLSNDVDWKSTRLSTISNYTNKVSLREWEWMRNSRKRRVNEKGREWVPACSFALIE